jgi:hypothetical protein
MRLGTVPNRGGSPSVAAQAVGVKLVLVFEQACDGAEVDHGASVAPSVAQVMSRHRNHSGPLIGSCQARLLPLQVRRDFLHIAPPRNLTVRLCR